MRHLAGALIAIALLSLVVPAQTETATVEGIVVKQGSTDAVQGAVVTFTPSAGTSRTATSGEDGKFVVANLSPGRYQITSTRTGFVKARRDSGPANLTLVPGQRLTGVRIQLTPTAVITGRVLDENGMPKAQVSVSALRPEYQNGFRTLPCYAAQTARATTNANGDYRLFGLEPGGYYVAVALDGAICNTSFYPGVDDPRMRLWSRRVRERRLVESILPSSSATLLGALQDRGAAAPHSARSQERANHSNQSQRDCCQRLDGHQLPRGRLCDTSTAARLLRIFL